MKLIIINGPCGVGKSTLAEQIHADIPLSFLMDSYAQIRCISNYQNFGEERWEMTVAIANSLIDSMLGLGRDVVVDMMVYSSEVLDFFYEIAKRHGAEVHEILLTAPRDIVIGRAEKRGWHGGLLSREKVGYIWDRLEGLKELRDKANLIDTNDREVSEIYTEVKDLIK
ncbi:AAA family ATPase [Candidatus Uhrbacteria bacterium]|jgi:predicted kinase|nr:AAA family ATPase [Candidatus Uhrbacteria bacterium]